MKTRITFLAFALILLSCGQQEINLDEQVKPLLRVKWDTFTNAWEQEDARTCAAVYVDDGVNIPPQWEVNNGIPEIEKFYDFLFDNNISSEYQHDILSISGDTKNIIEMGKFKVNWVRNDSTSWTYYARTMTHWINVEGDWKIKTFIFNNPPED